MGEYACFDANKTKLHVGDGVMHLGNGQENEGIVIKILPGNRIRIDSQCGVIDVNGNSVYQLP